MIWSSAEQGGDFNHDGLVYTPQRIVDADHSRQRLSVRFQSQAGYGGVDIIRNYSATLVLRDDNSNVLATADFAVQWTHSGFGGTVGTIDSWSCTPTFSAPLTSLAALEPSSIEDPFGLPISGPVQIVVNAPAFLIPSHIENCRLRLTAYDATQTALGATSSDLLSTDISASLEKATDPVAVILTQIDGLDVEFDGSNSTIAEPVLEPDVELTDWDWTFDDGDTGTGETTTHTYNDAGSYTVTLRVTDEQFGWDEATTTLNLDPVEFDAIVTHSGAVMTADPSNGNVQIWLTRGTALQRESRALVTGAHDPSLSQDGTGRIRMMARDGSGWRVYESADEGETMVAV